MIFVTADEPLTKKPVPVTVIVSTVVFAMLDGEILVTVGPDFIWNFEFASGIVSGGTASGFFRMKSYVPRVSPTGTRILFICESLITENPEIVIVVEEFASLSVICVIAGVFIEPP